MNDQPPIYQSDSEAPMYQYQNRPRFVKRDSDVAAPVVRPMGEGYSYAPAANKKESK